MCPGARNRVRSARDATDRLLQRSRLHIDQVAPADVLESLLVTMPRWACIWRDGPRLEGSVHFEQASGRRESFSIAIAYDEERLRVFEREPRRIDPTCPGRHLYDDESFCLGFRLPGARPSKPWARAWWARLGGYIELQVGAEVFGEWPAQNSWPHSNAAATTQAQLEDALERLDTNVRAWMTTNSTSPRTCPCGIGRRFEVCHASEVTAIRALEAKRKEQDIEYWTRRAGQACCGVLRACPLRRPWDLFEA